MKKIITVLLAICLCGMLPSGCKNNSDEITVYMPDGNTAVSLSYMMKNHTQIDGKTVKYTVVPPSEIGDIAGKLEKDIVIMPIDAAANLYVSAKQETGGCPYKLAAVMTHGCLYLVGKNAGVITGFDDIPAEAKIGCIGGPNRIPDRILRYLLKQNGLNPDAGGDVTIQYFGDPSLLLGAIAAGTIYCGVAAEPEVTDALEYSELRHENLAVLADLQEEWEALGNGTAYPMAALMVRSSLGNSFIDRFLELAKQGDEWITKEENSEIIAQTVRDNMLSGKASTVKTLYPELIERCAIKTKTDGLKDYVNDCFALLGVTAPQNDFYYKI